MVDQAAMEASVKYWNAHGGIGGHPVKLTVLNDNGESERQVALLRRDIAAGIANQ